MKTDLDKQGNAMVKHILCRGIIVMALCGHAQTSYAADVYKVSQHTLIQGYGKVHP